MVLSYANLRHSNAVRNENGSEQVDFQNIDAKAGVGNSGIGLQNQRKNSNMTAVDTSKKCSNFDIIGADVKKFSQNITNADSCVKLCEKYTTAFVYGNWNETRFCFCKHSTFDNQNCSGKDLKAYTGDAVEVVSGRTPKSTSDGSSSAISERNELQCADDNHSEVPGQNLAGGWKHASGCCGSSRQDTVEKCYGFCKYERENSDKSISSFVFLRVKDDHSDYGCYCKEMKFGNCDELSANPKPSYMSLVAGTIMKSDSAAISPDGEITDDSDSTDGPENSRETKLNLRCKGYDITGIVLSGGWQSGHKTEKECRRFCESKKQSGVNSYVFQQLWNTNSCYCKHACFKSCTPGKDGLSNTSNNKALIAGRINAQTETCHDHPKSNVTAVISSRIDYANVPPSCNFNPAEGIRAQSKLRVASMNLWYPELCYDADSTGRFARVAQGILKRFPDLIGFQEGQDWSSCSNGNVRDEVLRSKAVHDRVNSKNLPYVVDASVLGCTYETIAAPQCTGDHHGNWTLITAYNKNIFELGSCHCETIGVGVYTSRQQCGMVFTYKSDPSKEVFFMNHHGVIGCCNNYDGWWNFFNQIKTRFPAVMNMPQIMACDCNSTRNSRLTNTLRDSYGLDLCPVDDCSPDDYGAGYRAGEVCTGHAVDHILVNSGTGKTSCSGGRGYMEGIGQWGSDHSFYAAEVEVSWRT